MTFKTHFYNFIKTACYLYAILFWHLHDLNIHRKQTITTSMYFDILMLNPIIHILNMFCDIIIYGTLFGFVEFILGMNSWIVPLIVFLSGEKYRQIYNM